MASGDKKYGRNKVEATRYKAQNRAEVNKRRRAEKHAREQAAHAQKKEVNHVVSRGAARDYRRNVAAYMQPTHTPDHTKHFTAMQFAVLKVIKG